MAARTNQRARGPDTAQRITMRLLPSDGPTDNQRTDNLSTPSRPTGARPIKARPIKARPIEIRLTDNHLIVDLLLTSQPLSNTIITILAGPTTPDLPGKPRLTEEP
jgi:hypothetical protein